MKHSIRITAILLLMFFITQLLGIFVVSQYSPTSIQKLGEDGNLINVTSYNLPYGLDPPENIDPQLTLISIMFAIVFAVLIMFMLMKYNAEIFLRVWFFIVVTLAISITLNSFFLSFQFSHIIAFLISLPFAFVKIFRRNIIVHNLTELIIYPGIAAIFVSVLNVWTVVLLLVVISIYDMYAVWYSGFMQKMAKYQIERLKVFSGFFIPYLGKEQRQELRKMKQSKKKDGKKMKVSLAILGGGDVVFPIILAGVVLNSLGLLAALIVSIGATLSLACLFYLSEKGKFYPAMPFISAGCFIALGIVYLIQIF